MTRFLQGFLCHRFVNRTFTAVLDLFKTYYVKLYIMLLNIHNKNKKDVLINIINQIIDDNQWDSKKAAYILRTALSDISHIRRSKATNFSLARLLIFLVRLDYRVTISINMKETIKQIEYFELTATPALT